MNSLSQLEEIVSTIWSCISSLHLHKREIEAGVTHTTSHRLPRCHSNRMPWWRSDQGVLELFLLFDHFFRHFGLRTCQWRFRCLIFFFWLFIWLLKPSPIWGPKRTNKSLQILSSNRFSCLPISRCGKFRGRWRRKEVVFMNILLTELMCKALGTFLLVQPFRYGDSKTSLILTLLLLSHSNLVLRSSKELMFG